MIRSASFVLLTLCALTVQGVSFVDNCGTLPTRSACYTQSDKCFWTTQGCVLSCNDDSSRPYCDSSSTYRINCTYLETAECQSSNYYSNCYVSKTTGKCTATCENVRDQSSCSLNGDCEWSQGSGICQTKCSLKSPSECVSGSRQCYLTEGPTPQCTNNCAKVYGVAACNATSGCTFVDNTCTFTKPITNKVCNPSSNNGNVDPFCSGSNDLYTALTNPSALCTACGLTPQPESSYQCGCSAGFSCQSTDCIRSSFTQSVELFAYAQYVGSKCYNYAPLPTPSDACSGKVCSIAGAYPCADTVFTMCNGTDFFASLRDPSVAAVLETSVWPPSKTFYDTVKTLAAQILNVKAFETVVYFANNTKVVVSVPYATPVAADGSKGVIRTKDAMQTALSQSSQLSAVLKPGTPTPGPTKPNPPPPSGPLVDFCKNYPAPDNSNAPDPDDCRLRTDAVKQNEVTCDVQPVTCVMSGDDHTPKPYQCPTGSGKSPDRVPNIPSKYPPSYCFDVSNMCDVALSANLYRAEGSANCVAKANLTTPSGMYGSTSSCLAKYCENAAPMAAVLDSTSQQNYVNALKYLCESATYVVALFNSKTVQLSFSNDKVLSNVTNFNSLRASLARVVGVTYPATVMMTVRNSTTLDVVFDPTAPTVSGSVVGDLSACASKIQSDSGLMGTFNISSVYVATTGGMTPVVPVNPTASSPADDGSKTVGIAVGVSVGVVVLLIVLVVVAKKFRGSSGAGDGEMSLNYEKQRV